MYIFVFIILNKTKDSGLAGNRHSMNFIAC